MPVEHSCAPVQTKFALQKIRRHFTHKLHRTLFLKQGWARKSFTVAYRTIYVRDLAHRMCLLAVRGSKFYYVLLFKTFASACEVKLRTLELCKSWTKMLCTCVSFWHGC